MKERITRTTKRLILVLVMAMVVFAAMPAAGFEAEAAPKKPGTIYTIKAKDITSDAVTIKWGKASGKVSGYAIYRNGKYLTSVNAKTFSYKEKKLKYSTKYTYHVRAFNRTGKKVKQYYNKKTKKWQKKAPSKEFRGKSRRVKNKVYGKKSPAMSVKTLDPVVFHGRVVTPSMCPMTFVIDSTKCKECGKGKTVTITYKNGSYSSVTKGLDCSKDCPYHDKED